jgi:threonine/homoserine/homoserine lactone efflux protein
MFSTVYKGIIIGILVSAPMGPIGLMCIQRTLNKGRWHGFFSGVGAAVSDLIYAMITCLGLGIVISFVETHQNILQIIGSLLLLLFGLYTFLSKPEEHYRSQGSGKKSTYSQDAITAFLLTLSNPLIILLYIALLAQFNFIAPDETISSIVVGLFCIMLGAICWWFVITTIVGKLRSIFKLRGLWIMNQVVGIVIMILALMGIVYTWQIMIL